MKNRLVVAFLLCVFLLGLASPAHAMPESKSVEPRLQINGQTEALSGETIRIEVRAWNETKGAQMVKYRIVLSKAFVTAVSVIEGSKIKARNAATAWVLEWAEVMPKSKKSVAVLLSVTLAAKTGTLPVMRIYQGQNIMVGLHKVNVSEPKLIFEAGMPESVVYGGRPFAYRLDAINKTQMVLPFNVRFDIYLTPATDGSSQYSSNGGEVYNAHSFSPDGNEMNHTGVSYYWRGILQPGERAKLEVITRSGHTPGSHLGFVVTDILVDGRSDEIGRYNIQIVKGSGPKYGMISLISAFGPGQPLIADQYAQLHVELFAPTLMQFIVSDISSTCPMAGLQNVIQSQNNVTWFEWANAIWIGGIEKPEGAVDPYYATCTISLKFHPWTYPGEVTEVSQDFQVLVP